jgi:hypothetical protein
LALLAAERRALRPGFAMGYPQSCLLKADWWTPEFFCDGELQLFDGFAAFCKPAKVSEPRCKKAVEDCPAGNIRI